MNEEQRSGKVKKEFERMETCGNMLVGAGIVVVYYLF